MLVVLLAIFVAMWLPFIVALLYAEYRDEGEDQVCVEDETFPLLYKSISYQQRLIQKKNLLLTTSQNPYLQV